MSKPNVTENFIKFYETFNLDDVRFFESLYDENVIFEDPFHKINGRANLATYMKKLMANTTYCRFVITQNIQDSAQGSACVCWRMHFGHKTLLKGKEIVVDGATCLRFTDKITFHRDYFDSSQLLYRNIPVLRSIIHFIESRM